MPQGMIIQGHIIRALAAMAGQVTTAGQVATAMLGLLTYLRKDHGGDENLKDERPTIASAVIVRAVDEDQQPSDQGGCDDHVRQRNRCDQRADGRQGNDAEKHDARVDIEPEWHRHARPSSTHDPCQPFEAHRAGNEGTDLQQVK